MARTLKEEPANGIGGVVDEASDTELDVAVGEFVDNVVCIAQRSSLLVEFHKSRKIGIRGNRKLCKTVRKHAQIHVKIRSAEGYLDLRHFNLRNVSRSKFCHHSCAVGSRKYIDRVVNAHDQQFVDTDHDSMDP